MLYDQEPKTGVEEGSENAKEESYSFMKETIKSSRKEHLIQVVRMAIGGLVFGIFACCGFFVLKPWVESTFYNETETVNIPEDDEVSEAVSQDVHTEAEDTEILTAQSYEEIMKSMYGIVEEADRSIVTIEVKQTEITAEGESDPKVSITGVIAADNGRQFLIMAEDSICDEGDKWFATFADKKQYAVLLKTRDKSRGIAIFSIERANMQASTKGSVKVCELGNSNYVLRGDIIIALGSMFGYQGGVGYGIVSSTEHEIAFADGNCKVIATDIEVAASGSGVLINQDGELIGLIKNSIWETEASKTANALAISDLKAVLEMMLNGEEVPYIGVHGTTVTDELAKEQGIPSGLYVTAVDADSPAMYAGIKVGDVIQEVNGIETTNLNNYERAVLNCDAGSEIKIKAKRRGAEEYVDVSMNVAIGSKK